MSDQTKYNQRGVSYSKSEVHDAIKGLDKGLYPMAFCKVLPDFLSNDDEYCNLMHADTAGTKTSLAYLYWKETGNLDVWKGIVQDALVMNLDDMGAVGATSNIILSSTIGRNKNLIPGEVLTAIIQGCAQIIEELKAYNVNLHLSGGETADVGDIVRTIDVGYTTFARMKKADLVINDIKDGNVIVGISSSGQCSYESTYNSGIGSNGLTSARHDTLSKYYADNYPEAYDPNTPKDVIFTGSKRLTDLVNIDGQDFTVGDLLLSPTRTFLPVLQRILITHKDQIDGIIHCTGGAQTKVLKFIENKKVIKNNLFQTPPVFQMIQQESKTDWREMYQVFNMGHRLEIYTNLDTANELIDIIRTFDIDAQIIGHVENNDGNLVDLRSPYGNFMYS